MSINISISSKINWVDCNVLRCIINVLKSATRKIYEYKNNALNYNFFISFFDSNVLFYPQLN